MSNLRSILNPEAFRKNAAESPLDAKRNNCITDVPSPDAQTEQLTTQPPMSPSCDPAIHSGSQSSFHHEEHPDCPDSMDCLPDTADRPQHTLPVILRCAILGSPKQRLTIREIYASMEAKYSYYSHAGPSWKQSVRHHLSLNNLFERRPRPVSDPGFGSYWTVNLSAPPGTKRPRKRGRPNKDPDSPSASLAKKNKERPTKDSDSPMYYNEPTILLSSHEEDEDDERSFIDGHMSGNGSDNDCESEEELVHPQYRRNSLVGLSEYPKPARELTLPPFSSLESSKILSEKMQIEVNALRRQSAEAISVSLRLAEQVSQAQAETNRMRVAVTEIENLLEEEKRKRRQLERNIEDETERRHSAEEALRAVMSASSLSRGSQVPKS